MESVIVITAEAQRHQGKMISNSSAFSASLWFLALSVMRSLTTPNLFVSLLGLILIMIISGCVIALDSHNFVNA
jgi:hypothetical protein